MSLFHEATTPPRSADSTAAVVLTNVDCDASVYIGAAVRMNSLGVAYNALADSVSNSNVIGIVQAKPTAVKCDIRVTGVTPVIFSALDPTMEYFLSSVAAGAIITTPPPLTAGYVVLVVGQPFSSTRFLVNKGNRMVRS